jgi:hypothetical protein
MGPMALLLLWRKSCYGFLLHLKIHCPPQGLNLRTLGKMGSILITTPMRSHYYNMNMTSFWDIALCSLIEADQRFRGAYCLHHQGDSFPWWWRQIHGAISQKAVIFMLAIMRTWNLRIVNRIKHFLGFYRKCSVGLCVIFIIYLHAG